MQRRFSVSFNEAGVGRLEEEKAGKGLCERKGPQQQYGVLCSPSRVLLLLKVRYFRKARTIVATFGLSRSIFKLTFSAMFSEVMALRVDIDPSPGVAEGMNAAADTATAAMVAARSMISNVQERQNSKMGEIAFRS